MTLGREPLTIVEIDLPVCIRTWGTAPCTAVLSAANASKCFNTLATCKATAAYSATTQTLRFAYNQAGLPKGQTIFPALKSVSTRAGEINLSGIDPRTNALGKRARVTVSLQDFTYHDTLTDPYQAERVSGAAQFSGVGYDPSRGTFFGKLIARQPYYVGKALRVKRGYVGDNVATMPTAHYVITEWSGPDASGAVQIVAKDVLDLADNAKAVAPKASRGKVETDITATSGSLTLTPAGVGAEYATSGRIAVGREVMTFSRSGDVMTLTARGVDGTTAEAHSANDVVQQCFRRSGARPCDVIRDLLVTFAGVDASFIDLTTWRAENDRWLPSIKMTATITKPTGVAALIGEICQHGVLTWWDETAQQVRYRANRPLDATEDPVPLSDAANLISGSPNIERGDDLRISELQFYHGVIDPTEGAENARNYTKLVIAPVESNPYGQDKIKTIYSRWLGQFGDDAAAASIAIKLRNRYQTTPNIVSGELDVKDKGNILLGSVVEVTSYLLQDATGANLPEQMQVNYLEEREGRLAFKAETYKFTNRYGIVAPSGTPNYSAASADRKRAGTFVVSASSLTFPDGSGPYVAY